MHCSYERVHQTLLGNICFDCMLTNAMELKKKKKTIALCNYATSVTPLFILSTLNACESREICLDYPFTVPTCSAVNHKSLGNTVEGLRKDRLTSNSKVSSSHWPNDPHPNSDPKANAHKALRIPFPARIQ